MNSIAEIYREVLDVLDNRVSILSLYVYSLLINDERAFNKTDSELEELVDEIIDRYYDNSPGGIFTTIDAVLDDNDSAWYY